MTSNAGSNLNTNAIGFNNENQANKNKILDIVKSSFRAEFINRIDEIIVFNSLNKEQLLQIIDLMLKDTINALSQKNMTLDIDSSAKEFILEKGTDLKYGARPLRRAIQRYLEDEIAERILMSEFTNGQTIHVTLANDKLEFFL